MHVALAQKHVDVGLVRVFTHGVTKKNNRIQLSLRDASCNLGISAERPRSKALDRQSEFSDTTSSCPCSHELTMAKPIRVSLHKVHQVILLSVMSDECNPFHFHGTKLSQSTNA